jgi:hypothetical protein
VIEVRNNLVAAALDDRTGSWQHLRFAGDGGTGASLVRPGGPVFDLVVDGAPLFGDAPRKLSDVSMHEDGRAAALVYEHEGLRITHSLELDAELPLLRQSVRIEVTSGPARKLTSVEYFLPGLVVGDPGECLLQAPGTIVLPDSSYGELAKLPLDRSYGEPLPWFPQGWLDCAPDGSSGLVAVENRERGRVVSAWMHDEERATAFSTIDGDGERVTVAHLHQLAAWLKPGVRVESGGHRVLLTEGSWREHLGRFRGIAYGGWRLAVEEAPSWVSGMRLFQIDPRPISAWHARLDELRGMGFNVLYLMPVWHKQDGVYALIDHYSIDPEVGTEDEIKAFVEAAHERGMKVLFDFIPQGIGVHSPFVEEHPDWLVRDELGRPFASHGWGPKAGEPLTEGGTFSLDWGRPDYQDFAVRWAMWNVETFDTDGFRTDAMHWKEPNFGPENPYPAWQTMFGGVRLAAKLREALKARKPDAILFSEVGGPVFQKMHESVYDNGWLLWRANESWLGGEPHFTGAEWTRLLADAEAARPQGTPRAVFTANHDLPWIAEAAKESPLGDTVSFVHAFSAGFPFVTWAEIEGREAFFTGLMREREHLNGYSASHDRVAAEAPELFTALWTKDGERPVLAVANLSPEPVRSPVRLDVEVSGVGQRYGSEGVSAAARDGKLDLRMPPGGYALIEVQAASL